MSWVRVNMRFPGTCLECRKRIKLGEQALWSRGVGVKHIECAEGPGQDRQAERSGRTGRTVQVGLDTAQGPTIACAVCGKPAGCGTCELADSCDIKKVSPLCICTQCNSGDAMAAYVTAVSRKFPALQEPRQGAPPHHGGIT